MKHTETTNLGVQLEVSYRSSSTSVQGMELSASETTVLDMMLPHDVGVHASFSREGFGKKLAKLFKKELQTGDRAFDDAIYISTDTPESTTKLLADEQVRSTIALYVTTGGPIEIHGNKMRMTLLGRQNNEDPVVVALLRAVLGVAQP